MCEDASYCMPQQFHFVVLNIYILNKAKLCPVVVLVYLSLTDFFHMLCFSVHVILCEIIQVIAHLNCTFLSVALILHPFWTLIFLFNEKFASIFSYT